MTVKTTYTANGANKDFVVGFPYLANADVHVFDDGVLKVLGTHYNIQTAEQQSSDNGAKNIIHFGTAPTNAHTIKIVRSTALSKAVPGAPSVQIGQEAAQRALYLAQELAGFGGIFDADFGETALLAGTAVSFEAPHDLTIDKLRTEVKKAVTTGGAITVEVDTVAVTGLSTTVADTAIVGVVAEDTPTAVTHVKGGQTITITPAAAFATAGDVAAKLFMTVE